MGFGLIFGGYISLLFLRVFPAELIGFFVIYLGLDKLTPYGRDFVRAKYASLFMVAYSAIYTVIWGLQYFDVTKSLFENTFFSLINNILYFALVFVFHYFLYKALYSISSECGYEKGIRRIKRNGIGGVIFACAIFVNLLLPKTAQITQYFGAALLFFELFWLICNSVMLYGCYMMIATDEIIAKEEAEAEKSYSKVMRQKGNELVKKKLEKKRGKKSGKTYRIKK